MNMKTMRQSGLTLIELLFVIAIIAILVVRVTPALLHARTLALVTQAGVTQVEMTRATELYHDDMGFYPPDVNRGWDPGFEKPLPWSPDAPGSPGTNCGHCPANWQDIVAEKWNGPYLKWPRKTPWGGRYDYNYWPNDVTRYGCPLKAGIYMGVQGDYANNHKIPDDAEDEMIKRVYEYEKCKNGESQMLLWEL